MTYFGWAGDRPLPSPRAGVPARPAPLCRPPCCWRELLLPWATAGPLGRRHQDGTSGPSGLQPGESVGSPWPQGRRAPCDGDTEAKHRHRVLTVYPSDVSFLKSILRKRQPPPHTLSSPRGQLTAPLLLWVPSAFTEVSTNSKI